MKTGDDLIINAANSVASYPHVDYFVFAVFVCLGIALLPIVVRRGGNI
jgi:hypothetical protein